MGTVSIWHWLIVLAIIVFFLAPRSCVTSALIWVVRSRALRMA